MGGPDGPALVLDGALVVGAPGWFCGAAADVDAGPIT